MSALNDCIEAADVPEKRREEARREWDGLKEQLKALRSEPRHVAALRVGIDWHQHDGMVTVYDRDGRYMGCMGVERFHRLLAEDGAVRREPYPASTPKEEA